MRSPSTLTCVAARLRKEGRRSRPFVRGVGATLGVALGLLSVAAPVQPAAAALAGAGVASAPSASPSTSSSALAAAQSAISRLPAPFSNWHVTLTERASEQGTLELQYDSPALGIRTVNSVFLPTSYRADAAPSPVMYYLHGTVVSFLDNPLTTPVTRQEALLNDVGSEVAPV